MTDRPTIRIRDYQGYSDIARALGLSRQRVWHWFQEGSRIPAERVLDVERVTGIPRHKLRPDLYQAPNPSDEAA